jgi:MFS family permease
MSSTFRSLAGVNYRLWFAGALVSNIGTWMQRTAQDWIVLTELTDNDAVAVGITMSLQLGPQLLLVPFSGLLADRFDKRRLLLATNLTMGVLAAVLGVLAVTGAVQLWHVYLLALGLGVTSAIDAPARQAFVSELVSEKNLPNAVSLNSASFNGARLIGPAAAGVLTASVGAGWVFLINAVTFAATLAALLLLHRDELRTTERAAKGRGQLLRGLGYVRSRADLVVVFIIVFLIGTFGLNFPIFASTMASVEFHHGAGEFGVVSSVLAIGSLSGALLAARRERARMRTVILSAGAFGVSMAIASVMPSYWSFAAACVLVGFFAITLMTTANSVVQTRTSPQMRGRVMALYLAIFMGGTPLGAPIVGAVANGLGPRWALGVGALSGALAALVGLIYLVRERGLRLRYSRGFYLSWAGNDRDRAREKLAAAESEVPRG